MGILRSRKNEQPEKKPPVVQYEAFVGEADATIAKASDPKIELEDAVSSAKGLKAKLGEVSSGQLIVQPPISGEQIADYNGRVDSIIGVGEKALGALKEAAVPAVPKAASTFSGHGSSSKS